MSLCQFFSDFVIRSDWCTSVMLLFLEIFLKPPWKSNLLASHSLSFCFKESLCLFFSFWKDCFSWCKILGHWLSPPRTVPGKKLRSCRFLDLIGFFPLATFHLSLVSCQLWPFSWLLSSSWLFCRSVHLSLSLAVNLATWFPGLECPHLVLWNNLQSHSISLLRGNTYDSLKWPSCSWLLSRFSQEFW